ncbi:ferredoxin [Halapricum desulfuricans]|uniref:Ferredoxin n=1 Tax=Halapricum desulfuricans TaxID=2841257 RepID=A0A897NM88_9EURY|nr:ferredoxin [Halapricum desulfuricans]QSG13867.1 Ferredoxin [Halapricum desulfuricans]
MADGDSARHGNPENDPIRASEIGGTDAPPIDEKPYKIVFEANLCIGAGKCAAVSPHWDLDLDTGLAQPATYYVGEDDLAHQIDAAESCPAKNGRGVIHVVDRRTDEEIAPDPEGDGRLSVDW